MSYLNLKEEDACCENCVFYVKGSESNGVCRRYPPHPIISPEGEWLDCFPDSKDYEWCGEWKPIPAKEEK